MTTPTKSSGTSISEMLDRLHELAIDALGDDLGLANHQFVTFAAHHLDKDGELQLSASQHFEGIGSARIFDAQRDVGQQFFFEALAKIARGHVLSVFSREGEVLTVNSMAMVGSSMAMCGSGAGFSASVMVSPMVIPSTPATATMSPSSVSVISVRFRPEKEKSLVIFVLWREPSSFAMATSSPVNIFPLKTRAMARRPR